MSTLDYTAITKQRMPLWQVRARLAWKGLKGGWTLFRENPVGLVGIGLIVFFGLMAVLHPILMATVWGKAIYDPIIGHDREIVVHPSPPTWIHNASTEIVSLVPISPFRHILGTDPLGRDILSQLMYSTQSEFALGIMASLVTVLIATTVGAVSAYYGGMVDMIFMRIADVILMLPFIPILIVLSAMFDFQMIHLAIVYGILAGFGGSTIVIKSQALTVKVKSYIEAARVATTGTLFSHIWCPTFCRCHSSI
jgi:peptide/nickel transport system permease protein